MPTLICGVQRDLFKSLFPTLAVPSTQPVETTLATLATVNVVLPVLMAVCSGPAPCGVTTAALKRAAAAKSARQWADEVCGELSARGQPTVRELARALCTLRPPFTPIASSEAPTATTVAQARALSLAADQCPGVVLEAIWLRMPIGGDSTNTNRSDVYVVVGQDALEDIEEPTSQRGLLFAVNGDDDEVTSIEEVLHAHVKGNVPLVVQGSTTVEALELEADNSIVSAGSTKSTVIPTSHLYPRSARDAYSGSPLPHDAIFATTLNNLCDQPKIRTVCGRLFSVLGRRRVGGSTKLEDLAVPKKAFKTFLEGLLVLLSTSRLDVYLAALPGHLSVGARQRLDALVGSIAEQVVAAELSKLHIVTAVLYPSPPLTESEVSPSTTVAPPPPSRGVAPMLPGDSSRLASHNARPQPCIAFRDFYRALVRILLYFVVEPPTPTRTQCELPSSPFDAVISLIHLNAYPIANLPPPPSPVTPSPTTTNINNRTTTVPQATSTVPVLSKNSTVSGSVATEEVLLDTVENIDDDEQDANYVAGVITNGSVVGFGTSAKGATVRGGVTADQPKKRVSKQESDDRRRRLQLLDSYPVQRGGTTL